MFQLRLENELHSSPWKGHVAGGRLKRSNSNARHWIKLHFHDGRLVDVSLDQGHRANHLILAALLFSVFRKDRSGIATYGSDTFEDTYGARMNLIVIIARMECRSLRTSLNYKRACWDDKCSRLSDFPNDDTRSQLAPRNRSRYLGGATSISFLPLSPIDLPSRDLPIVLLDRRRLSRIPPIILCFIEPDYDYQVNSLVRHSRYVLVTFNSQENYDGQQANNVLIRLKRNTFTRSFISTMIRRRAAQETRTSITMYA